MLRRHIMLLSHYSRNSGSYENDRGKKRSIRLLRVHLLLAIKCEGRRGGKEGVEPTREFEKRKESYLSPRPGRSQDR